MASFFSLSVRRALTSLCLRVIILDGLVVILLVLSVGLVLSACVVWGCFSVGILMSVGGLKWMAMPSSVRYVGIAPGSVTSRVSVSMEYSSSIADRIVVCCCG